MNTALSLGGVALALGILYLNLRPWWKSGRDPKALVPFGSGCTLGSLATVCVGGLLGWSAAGSAGLLSEAGDKTVSGVTGTGSAPVGSVSAGALTDAGGVVVFLIFVGVVVLFRSSGKLDKRRIIGGFLTGVTLGVLPGVAVLVARLVLAVNWTGGQGYAALTGGGAL